MLMMSDKFIRYMCFSVWKTKQRWQPCDLHTFSIGVRAAKVNDKILVCFNQKNIRRRHMAELIERKINEVSIASLH